MNKLRVSFVKESLHHLNRRQVRLSSPLRDLRILDVGCGGGILSEVRLCPFGIALAVKDLLFSKTAWNMHVIIPFNRHFLCCCLLIAISKTWRSSDWN